MTTAAIGVCDLWGGGTLGSVLASVFDIPDTPVMVVSFLEFCPSLIVSGKVVESLRGRPLLRFGERVGFPSSLGGVVCEEGVTVLSCSGNLGGVLGGRPLFLFKGIAREFALDSVEVEVVSLPGGMSVFLDWFAPLPLPRFCCCCCSTS